MVFNGSRVFELALLGEADELLDVVPLTPEQSAIIRNGVICAIDGRNTADDSEFAALRLFGESVFRSRQGEAGSSRSISSMSLRDETAFRQLA